MQRSELRDQYDVVISGMGGAGLFVAWEECFKAYEELPKNQGGSMSCAPSGN